MKITWKFYGSIYGATACPEGEVGETLAELLSPRGDWHTFGADGDTIIISEEEM